MQPAGFPFIRELVSELLSSTSGRKAVKLKHTMWSTIAATSFAAVLVHAAEVPPWPPVFSDPLAITNLYHPFVTGRVKTFEVQEGNADAMVVDTYLPDIRIFDWSGTSVACHTLQEMEVEDGEIQEISRNFFAQADDGTVYYFGETVDNYENGVIVAHHGGWLVGGPQAGDPPETATALDPTVFMPAFPEVGDVFKPEDLFPFADESDEVLKVGKTVAVSAGQFAGCIKIEESSLLSEDTETKWYAPGVGVIQVKEQGSILELVDLLDP
jgi:hypothetical protein